MVGKRCLHSQVPAAWHPCGDGGCGSERTASAGTGCGDSACGMLKLPCVSRSAKILSCCTDSKPGARGRACLAHTGTGWALPGCTEWFAHRAVRLAPATGMSMEGSAPLPSTRAGVPRGHFAPRRVPGTPDTARFRRQLGRCHVPQPRSGERLACRHTRRARQQRNRKLLGGVLLAFLEVFAQHFVMCLVSAPNRLSGRRELSAHRCQACCQPQHP